MSYSRMEFSMAPRPAQHPQEERSSGRRYKYTYSHYHQFLFFAVLMWFSISQTSLHHSQEYRRESNSDTQINRDVHTALFTARQELGPRGKIFCADNLSG